MINDMLQVLWTLRFHIGFGLLLVLGGYLYACGSTVRMED